jgi:predicted nuclease of predicted toxin-antitoxin system
MLKFKIDENLPVEAAELLRQANYDAVTVFEQQLEGRADPDIATICQREQRCLVTLDKDFADIRSYPPEQFSGLIVLRLHQQDKLYVLNIIKEMIKLLARESVAQRLWIVEEKRVRIRGSLSEYRD